MSFIEKPKLHQPGLVYTAYCGNMFFSVFRDSKPSQLLFRTDLNFVPNLAFHLQ